MTNTKKVNIILLLLFFGDAFVSPFLALYFIHLGFSNAELGILLAIKPLCSLLGNFIYGHFSKGLKRDLLLFRIICAFLIVSMVAFAFTSNFIVSVVLMVIWSLNGNVLFSFSDGIAEKCCIKDNKKYSITRMFGSYGYLVALLIGGSLDIAGLLNYPVLFIISSVIYIGVIVITFFIDEFDTLDVPVEKITFKQLFKSKSFIKYIIFYFFVLGIWKVTDDYSSQFFNSLGLSDGEWSFLYAGEVVVEIITIVLLEKIIKRPYSFVLVMIASGVSMALRTLLFALPIKEVPLAVLTGALRGIAWGTFIVGHMQLMKRMLGGDLVTKGVTLLAVEVSIFSTVGNFFYLPLVDAIGTNFTYLIFSGLQIIGVIFLLTIDFSFIKNEKCKKDVIIKEDQ